MEINYLTAINACDLNIIIFYIRPDLVMTLLWQIIKADLLRGVSFHSRPELLNLLNVTSNEDISFFMKLSNEHILLRWVNYHVVKSRLTPRVATNFGSDLAVCDGLGYSMYEIIICVIYCFMLSMCQCVNVFASG